MLINQNDYFIILFFSKFYQLIFWSCYCSWKTTKIRNSWTHYPWNSLYHLGNFDCYWKYFTFYLLIEIVLYCHKSQSLDFKHFSIVRIRLQGNFHIIGLIFNVFIICRSNFPLYCRYLLHHCFILPLNCLQVNWRYTHIVRIPFGSFNFISLFDISVCLFAQEV